MGLQASQVPVLLECLDIQVWTFLATLIENGWYNLQQQSTYHLGTFRYHLESFGIIWNHLVNIWTHLVNIWTMDFTQMMTLLIVSQRHFMHGPSNVYRVIWDCIGVILTPCSLFYL